MITLEDLYARAVLDKETGCLEWQGTNTYGSVRHNNKKHGVHRLVYMLTHNVTLTASDFVCHDCDNTACINADHLFLGTNSSNMLDAVAKGRHRYIKQDVRGERNGSAKLSEGQVIEIRKLLAQGERQSSLASQYGVDPTSISKIATRKAWGWL